MPQLEPQIVKEYLETGNPELHAKIEDIVRSTDSISDAEANFLVIQRQLDKYKAAAYRKGESFILPGLIFGLAEGISTAPLLVKYGLLGLEKAGYYVLGSAGAGTYLGSLFGKMESEVQLAKSPHSNLVTIQNLSQIKINLLSKNTQPETVIEPSEAASFGSRKRA